MRLKSYFVHTMEEALQAAKLELGDEAMLVDSKPLETPPGGRARLEVIFAAPVTPPPPPKAAPLPGRPAIGSIAGLQRFRGELTVLLDALERQPDTTRLEPFSPARPWLNSLRAQLLLSEVPAATTDELLLRWRPILEGHVLRDVPDDSDGEGTVLPLLTAEWPHAGTNRLQPARILAFAGPTCSGKTSAIAKLAFRLGVSQGRPVSVLSIDNLRIGASDQLAQLCSLLGVPFQCLEYSSGLHSAVLANAQRGMVLIDTPGYGTAHADVMAETAEHVSRVEGIECHLVLPANLRFREMQRSLRQYVAFAPSRLLFTRLDETEFFGPAWALARECRVPVDWVSTGPGIPEDLDEADASRFAAAVLGLTARPEHSSAPIETPTLASAARAGASRI